MALYHRKQLGFASSQTPSSKNGLPTHHGSSASVGGFLTHRTTIKNNGLGRNVSLKEGVSVQDDARSLNFMHTGNLQHDLNRSGQ
mmetsp:Transcript_15943/g.26877  ORF Transcript_15943/g.26877 Transcript_15943/m.26877 type:complete len:85 (+) Transcript_15943:408-662(+)